MIIYRINSKKDFDKIWKAYQDTVLELVQSDQYVSFFKGNHTVWQIDFINFYSFFDEKIHGPDPIVWGK